uniref:DNA replication licensing factor MCM2 n=1 Tax=Euplotes harpa TaxID=151035 RepID=A0A7S3N4W0_9SPIT|mmetsp:Transcript_11671/g.13249  ORF Transcript_11671/g.13249 Transcript_11671/m.13249 type:complete len:767 (+) Transcript_11671:471-2771(+)
MLDEDSDDDLARQLRRERLRINQEPEADGEEEDDAKYLDIEEAKGNISEWLQQPRTIKFIRHQFSSFLRNFKDEREIDVYEQRITEMCSNNKQSLEVTYSHLSLKIPTLAIWVAECPSLTLPIFNEVAFELVTEVFPAYENVYKQVFVRIRDLPIEDNLRDLRQIHLNALIKIKGVVTKRTGIYPQMKKVFFFCKCGERKGPIYLTGDDEAKLGNCYRCHASGPFVLDYADTEYNNYQKITVQETPGTVPPGRVPRQKEVVLQADLVDIARPGDEVEITGIYTSKFDYNMNYQHGFPIFTTHIEANYIKRLQDLEHNLLTEDEIMEIRKLAKCSNITKRLVSSIAPSIHGHNFIKTAIILAMFGGEPKDVGGKHKIRGDINVLLLGDPGTAKSQFLKYVENTFHRVVYTTGKGASAVGLTAGVIRDPITREWMLEGGALVLADKGVCLIDEFDKMNEQDRTSIHEAMEQQSISISKAGIVTSLQARCSVIAAANPIFGRYDPQRNFMDNVDLTEPILSRFDILSVVRDEVDYYQDKALATFVINSHIKSHPDEVEPEYLAATLLDDESIKVNEEDLIPQDMLKKYILYARKFVHPKLTDVDKEKISDFYSTIRKYSSAIGGIPIGVRHIEGMLRMSEAHAKMHLREYVRAEDVDVAIKMLLESFLQSQKSSIASSLRPKLMKYLSSSQDDYDLLYHILKQMVKDKARYTKLMENVTDSIIDVDISKEQFAMETKDIPQFTIERFFKSSDFTREFVLDGSHIRTKAV